MGNGPARKLMRILHRCNEMSYYMPHQLLWGMMLPVKSEVPTFSCTEEAFRYLGSFAGARKLGRSPESELLLTSNVNWRATASASARPRNPAAQLKPAEALKIKEREISSGMGPERLLKLALKYQQSRKKGAVTFVALGRGPLHADIPLGMYIPPIFHQALARTVEKKTDSRPLQRGSMLSMLER